MRKRLCHPPLSAASPQRVRILVAPPAESGRCHRIDRALSARERFPPAAEARICHIHELRYSSDPASSVLDGRHRAAYHQACGPDRATGDDDERSTSLARDTVAADYVTSSTQSRTGAKSSDSRTRDTQSGESTHMLRAIHQPAMCVVSRGEKAQPQKHVIRPAQPRQPHPMLSATRRADAIHCARRRPTIASQRQATRRRRSALLPHATT
jgi:hypothetical protein